MSENQNQNQSQNQNGWNESDKRFLLLWAGLGFFLGPFGVLASWLLARKGSANFRDNAIWFSLIGFAVWMVISMLYMMFTGASILDAALQGAQQQPQQPQQSPSNAW